MIRKFLMLFAVAAMFSLAIAAYAYTQNTPAAAGTAASCCKKSDSCPMKGKSDHEQGGEHAKMSCCKKHGGDHAKAEGAGCDCCGDSCPMKNGDASAAGHHADGKNCCDNCDCCGGKAKKDS